MYKDHFNFDVFEENNNKIFVSFIPFFATKVTKIPKTQKYELNETINKQD